MGNNKGAPSRMLKWSIDPNCKTAHMRHFQSLARSPFSPRLLVVSPATLLFDSTRSLGLRSAPLAISPTVKKRHHDDFLLRFSLFSLHFKCLSLVLQQQPSRLCRITLPSSHTPQRQHSSKVLGVCVCERETWAGFNICFRKSSQHKGKLFVFNSNLKQGSKVWMSQAEEWQPRSRRSASDWLHIFRVKKWLGNPVLSIRQNWTWGWRINYRVLVSRNSIFSGLLVSHSIY